MSINYKTGDATAPQGTGHKIIVHVCNDLGKWGKGFVLAISKRWKAPEKTYKAAFASDYPPKLGEVQFVKVTDEITVANLIGQHGIKTKNSKSEPPIRYPVIKQALQTITDYALENNSSVHMPRIGCGLAGGNWEEIEPLIEKTLGRGGIETTVYDFS